MSHPLADAPNRHFCTVAAALALLFLVSLLGAGCGISGAPQTTLAAPTHPALSATPTDATQAFVPCPTGSPRLTDIQSGGEGATLDTFSSRWGPADGVALGNIGFGRYSDSGQDRILVPSHLPDSERVWAVQYFVDTTQQVSMAQAATIAATIFPKDAIQHGATQTTVQSITVHYCSAALLAAFPPGSSVDEQPMPDTGYLTVGYILRSDATVDSISIIYGGQ